MFVLLFVKTYKLFPLRV